MRQFNAVIIETRSLCAFDIWMNAQHKNYTIMLDVGY